MAFRFRYIALFLLLQTAFFKTMATPKVSFKVSASSGCSPLLENYYNFTTGGSTPYTYLWKLGNSNTSTLQNASAIYYVPGKYLITLVVTDAKGNVDSASQTITVFKNPTADFSADNQVGCAPLKVNVKDLSSGGSAGISNWLWDFGDGNTSTKQNPGTHTYSKPGIYNISLEVTDSNGCIASVIKKSYIDVDQPPAVNFSASVNYACKPPLSVNFSGTVTPNQKVTYSWDFGDGTTATGANPSKTYNSKGGYTVTLTITDSLGCTASKTVSNFIFIGSPVASYTSSGTHGCAPLTVNFTNTSTGTPPGTTFLWKFGDGTTSTDFSPSHTYGAGNYTVTLIAITPGGCTDTLVLNSVIARAPYTPSFLTDTFLCQLPYFDYFENTTPFNATVQYWDFGDGSGKISGNSVNHKFPKTGGYFTITLTTYDAYGCVETLVKKDYVFAGPTNALFTPDTVLGCAPLTATFKNESKSADSIVSYHWNFGNGNSSDLKDPPTQNYSLPGDYTVTLTIKTKHGCVETYQGTVRAGTKPDARFTCFPDSGCLNMLRHIHFINLTNKGYGAIQANKFTWEIGGQGYNTTSDSPFTFRFDEPPGKYSVTLIAYNDASCPDSITKDSIIIVMPPWAKFGVIRDTCALQNRLTFVDASIGASHVEYYFGDGDSSDLRDPTHVYQDSGMYYPFEVAYDSLNHCSDTFSYFQRPPLFAGLYIKPPWKDTITAISATSGCNPLTVRFRVFDNDTAINTIKWGDGDTTILSSPFYYGPFYYLDTITVEHTYNTPGTYTVSMHDINDKGCRDTFQMQPRVQVLGLKAFFSATPAKGCVPFTVTLYDSFPNLAGVTTNHYDMGNGDTVHISSQVMTYTYTKPAPDQEKGFTVKLIAGNYSCTDTGMQKVFPIQPAAIIDEFNVSTCDSIAYVFTTETKGIKPFKYMWNFGGGDSIAGTQAAHTFGVGANRVKVRITDSMGCIDTLSAPITVMSKKDSAAFTIKLSQGNCPPITANFIDSSKFAVPGAHQWLWDFGDGSSSTLQNPSKVYYFPGNYSITLKIKDAIGCTSSVTKLNVIIIKGPTGEYSITPLKGCAPVSVHFTAISTNATKYSWDFGDGSPFGPNDTATHTYRYAGTFIPSLVLGDNTCTYPLPPKDTIVVGPLPVPAFGYDSTCSGLPLSFKDLSSSKSKIIGWIWNFGDGNTSYMQNPTHIYHKNGFYSVTLSITNINGCSKSITNSVKYGDIIARLSVSKTGCLGAPVQFKDHTISDSTIKSWTWIFGDGGSSNLQNPTHIYKKKGIYPVSLYVENYKGCYDTLKNGAYVIIGDTVAPKSPDVYRVTVIDDQNAEVDFSQNRDFDFKKYLIYMRNETGKVQLVDSVLFASDTDHIVSGLNNLHHSLCFMVQAVNICGYRSDTMASLYHCTINLGASPGINEAILKWTPYGGWPVSQYKIYKQGKEQPPQFNFLDSVPGSQLKYIDTSVVCYKPMVYRVEGFEQNGNLQVSWSDTAATIPVHVPHVPPANMLRATVENNKSTRVEWLSVPNAHIKNWMLEKSSDGIHFQLVDTPIVCNTLSEADQKVDVQKNSYTYRLRILDSCGDLGPYSEIGKTILLSIDTTVDVKPSLVWSSYKNWPEGVQFYDIYIEGSDKNFTWLARTVSGQDTVFIDNITDLNSLPNYTYHVLAHRNGTIANPNQNLSITSMSNDATLRPHSRLFIPNVFTPNGDGVNDSFFVQGLFIKSFHVKIFDRWGTKVFESGSIKEKWSGSYKNGPPVMDAYKYLIYYLGVDNVERYTDGWVTILL